MGDVQGAAHVWNTIDILSGVSRGDEIVIYLTTSGRNAVRLRETGIIRNVHIHILRILCEHLS
jgi:hypothetical protein